MRGSKFLAPDPEKELWNAQGEIRSFCLFRGAPRSRLGGARSGQLQQQQFGHLHVSGESQPQVHLHFGSSQQPQAVSVVIVAPMSAYAGI